MDKDKLLQEATALMASMALKSTDPQDVERASAFIVKARDVKHSQAKLVRRAA